MREIKTKVNSLFTATVLLLSMMSPFTVLTQVASAATVTWDGEGADNNWSTATNWSGDAVPVDGDIIDIDLSVATTYQESMINDLTLNLAGITLSGTGSTNNSYKVTGNDLTLSGPVTGSPESGELYLDVNVTLGANVLYDVANSALVFGSNTSTSTLNLSTYDMTFSSPEESCRYTNVYLKLNGSGNITSTTGSSAVNLRSGSAGYSGDITIDGEGLGLYQDSVNGFVNITMNGTSRLTFAAGSATTFDVNLTMNSSADPALYTSYSGFGCGGAGDTDIFTVSVDGNLTLGRDTIYSGINNLDVNGTYTSSGHTLSVKSGSRGSITTSAGTTEATAVTTTIESTDESTTYLAVGNKQTVILNGKRGSVSVSSGGLLKGSGTAESIYVFSGGTLAPGNSPGCMTVTTGGLNLAGTYEVELEGTTACSGYDQTDVTGTVTLTGATLNLSLLNNYKPKLNDTFTIIKNDGSDAVVDTFTGKADGSRFDVAGVTFEINYDGGDGNDVVLTAVAVPTTASAPDTGMQSIVKSPLLSLLSVGMIIGFVIGFKKVNG